MSIILSIVLFILHAFALTIALLVATGYVTGVARLVKAKKEGKKFVPRSVALSDPNSVERKDLKRLTKFLFVVSCFVILALSVTHIISI